MQPPLAFDDDNRDDPLPQQLKPALGDFIRQLKAAAKADGGV